METSTGSISSEQIRFYEENGYLILRKVFTPEEIQLLRTRFDEYANGRPIPQRMDAIFNLLEGEEKKSLFKLRYWEEDEILFPHYCANPKLVSILKTFLGPNIKSICPQINNETPYLKSPSNHHFHQNIWQFPIRPIDGILEAWTPMVDVNKENGSFLYFFKSFNIFLRFSYNIS